MLKLRAKWNWGGFLFSWVWAWYRGSHVVGLSCLLVFVCLYVFEKEIGGELAEVIRFYTGFVLSLFFGVFGESIVSGNRKKN
jgi:hypothetical protein